VATGTGRLRRPSSQDNSNDLSGNLKEWVNDPRVVAGQTVHTLRGGSFDNYAAGHDLRLRPDGRAETYSFANAGFRCCSLACGGRQIECSGACVNPATSATNCGACGRPAAVAGVLQRLLLPDRQPRLRRRLRAERDAVPVARARVREGGPAIDRFATACVALVRIAVRCYACSGGFRPGRLSREFQ
jgi:hypothetical protein